MENSSNSIKDETVNILKEETPLGRLGTPEDIASTISFLADESAGFITGQVLTVDGGITERIQIHKIRKNICVN